MKKLISFIVVLGIILSYSVFANAEGSTKIFSDVDFNSDVGKDIQKLLNAGIVNGNGDGTFTPQNPVTRAELCKMVNKLRGYNTIADVNFTDVTPDKWYYTQVLIGKQAGYINGFPDGTFRGDEYITREQVCAIICRAFGIYDLGLSAGITDEVSEWALPYVNALITNKLISLEAGNTFRATENMKRGELSTSLAKFVVETPAIGSTGTSSGTSSGGSVISGGSSGSSSGNGGGSQSGGNSTGSGNTGSGNTGSDNTGSDNTGSDNTGSDNTGSDNTGSGNTGSDNTGSGNTGSGNTGSDNTGSGTIPEESDGMSKEEIIAANEEILIYLRVINDDLAGGNFAGKHRTIVNIVKSCVTDAIAIGENGEQIISRDFIYSNYEDRISEAKSIYYGMTEEAQAAFISAVQNEVSDATEEYLMEMFL